MRVAAAAIMAMASMFGNMLDFTMSEYFKSPSPTPLYSAAMDRLKFNRKRKRRLRRR